MLPVVIEGLREDLVVFGRCNYVITDNEDEFAIRRLPAEWEVYTMEII